MKYAALIAVTALVTAAVTVPLVRRQAAVPSDAPASTVQQLMEGVVEPNARGVFESVGVISNFAGTVEHQPRTDEEWATVERHAAILAEAAALLKTPGRRVSDEPESVVSNDEAAPEHPPSRIETLIRENRAGWEGLADAVAAVAREAGQAARSRSVDGLYDTGSRLQEACEACHETFWYNAPAGTRIRR